MLELKELYKTFNPGTINAKTALSGLSVTLNDGDFVTVIGGNGEGKVLFNLHRGGRAHHGVLKDAADEGGALVLRKVRHVRTVDDDLAGVDEERAGGGVEHRRLARAVAADDGDEIAVVERDAQAAEGGLCVDRAGIKGLVEILEFKHSGCPLSACSAPCGGTFCSSSREWRGRRPRSGR